MAVVEVKGMSYHIGDNLKEKWDNLKDGKLTKYDEDRFYVTDGQEGSGKSLFTIQQAAYIDPTILENEGKKILPRICFTPEEFLYAIRHTKSSANETKVVIFDEAFRGMSSKGSISAVNKKVVQALMEMRQNNLVVFLVSPSFFLLELYPAMMRSKALFHVIKERNSKRRIVRIFGFKSKAQLYQIGLRKGWGYPIRTPNKVNFFNKYPGGDEFEARYRKKKLDSLRQEEKEEESIHKWKKQRTLAIKTLYNLLGSYEKVSEECKKNGFALSRAQIGRICTE
jgi:hypothetical protein